MAKIVAGVAVAALATAAQAETVGFDRDPAGAVPAGWLCGSTGGGAPRWAVEADAGAPSAPNVLKQSGNGAFPWCVKQGTALADGFVEVKFKPLSGSEDQAGGVVWRWKDGDNYYVARANALENNVSLYYTERGSRTDHQVRRCAGAGQRLAHAARRVRRHAASACSLDGKAYIELDDSHIAGAGAVGVWTKADSVTAFDDFAYQPAP